MSDNVIPLGTPYKFQSDYPCDVEPRTDSTPIEWPPEEMVEMPEVPDGSRTPIMTPFLKAVCNPDRAERYSPEVKPGLRVHESNPAQSTAAKILADAANLIDGDRDKQHGNRVECHTQIARLWTAFLGVKVDAVDVACLMVLLKIARTQTGSPNRDCWVDAAGYTALAGELSGNKA